MRSHAGGVLSAGEYHEALKDSRIRDLQNGPMTAQEMGIEGKYVALLSSKGFIKSYGKKGNSAVTGPEESMRCARRCLTHPALCEGRKCADFLITFQRKIDILSKPLSMYGYWNKNDESTLLGREARETQETERGKRSKVLGRMDPQDGKNRRRVNKSCLPRVRTSRKAGLVRQ